MTQAATTPGARPKSAPDFSVMTFNIRFGLADDGPNGWKHRKEPVARLLESVCPTFIGLQEANGFQIDFIQTLLPEYGCIGMRAAAPHFWQHNVIFHNPAFTPEKTAHFYLSPTPRVPSRCRRSRWPRQCSMGLFSGPGGKVLMVNTHLDFDSGVRVRSARLILRKTANSAQGDPAVLFGDFNDTPHSGCYKTLLAGEYGPAFRDTFHEPFPPTHHGFNGGGNGDHIDWILYTGNLAHANSRVITGTFGGRFPSDHYPVYSEFYFTEGAQGAGGPR